MADPETARRIHRALRRRPGPAEPFPVPPLPGRTGAARISLSIRIYIDPDWRGGDPGLLPGEAGMQMRRRSKGLRGLGGPLAALRFRLEGPIARADFPARLAERGDLPGLLPLAMARGGNVPFISSG